MNLQNGNHDICIDTEIVNVIYACIPKTTPSSSCAPSLWQFKKMFCCYHLCCRKIYIGIKGKIPKNPEKARLVSAAKKLALKHAVIGGCVDNMNTSCKELIHQFCYPNTVSFLTMFPTSN